MVRDGVTNPYSRIVFYLVLSAVFVPGLLLMPLVAWVERSRRAAGKPPSPSRPGLKACTTSHGGSE